MKLSNAIESCQFAITGVTADTPESHLVIRARTVLATHQPEDNWEIEDLISQVPDFPSALLPVVVTEQALILQAEREIEANRQAAIRARENVREFRVTVTSPYIKKPYERKDGSWTKAQLMPAMLAFAGGDQGTVAKRVGLNTFKNCTKYDKAIAPKLPEAIAWTARFKAAAIANGDLPADYR